MKSDHVLGGGLILAGWGLVILATLEGVHYRHQSTQPNFIKQLQADQIQEQMSNIRLQLTEDELDMIAITLSDIQQAHLREMRHPTNSLRCLTDNIYFEAGREPYAGKVAVAQVVMNRVADDFGGRSVCAVVYFKKRDPRNGKLEAAFSWTLGQAWRARGPIDWHDWWRCKQIAKAVLAGKLKSKVIGPNVEYYAADYIQAPWADQHVFVAQIGTQDFYQ